jgi:hypothetical protein
MLGNGWNHVWRDKFLYVYVGFNELAPLKR